MRRYVSRRTEIMEKWSRSFLSAHHRPLSKSSCVIFFKHRIHRGWPEDQEDQDDQAVRRKGSGAASTASVTSVICICDAQT